MSYDLLLIWIGESPYRYSKFSILLQPQQTRIRLGLLVRLASNHIGRCSYWTPGPGNIYGIITSP
jgi:hypothetical protein